VSEKKQKEEADEWLAQWSMGRSSIGAKDLGNSLRSVNLVLDPKSARTRLGTRKMFGSFIRVATVRKKLGKNKKQKREKSGNFVSSQGNS